LLHVPRNSWPLFCSRCRDLWFWNHFLILDSCLVSQTFPGSSYQEIGSSQKLELGPFLEFLWGVPSIVWLLGVSILASTAEVGHAPGFDPFLRHLDSNFVCFDICFLNQFWILDARMLISLVSCSWVASSW
jgi:hypothetical protein